MTNRTNPIRRHSRFPVSWPVLYGDGSFLAEGTILDLTSLGWKVAGAMPVAPGMRLSLKVSIPDRSTPLYIHHATVLWVKDHEFAIEAHEIEPSDQIWVKEFLQHKLGIVWMSRNTEQETSLQAKDKASSGESTFPQASLPFLEDMLHRFSAIDLASTHRSAEARGSGDSDGRENGSHMLDDSVPEKIWWEARRIVRRMIAIKAARAQTGRNPIPDN